MKADVVIIGAGVTGAAIARELSRYKLNIILIEKEADVACGTSKANSGIIHAGYNASLDTTKGKMNVRANPQFDEICADLKVPFDRIGSLVVGFNDDDLKIIKKKKKNGIKQGIKGLEIIGQDKLRDLEENINPKAKYALYAPTAGIISPYELAIGYADNAALNGVEVMLETEVTDLIIEDKQLQAVQTDKGIIETKVVVNAAGIFADNIAEMGGEKLKITPRKGEYHLFDKELGGMADHVLFPTPTGKSKGILVTPTVHGNLLIGPNSYEIDNKKDVSTTAEGMEEIMSGAQKLIPSLPPSGVITSFSGLRATLPHEDFIIGFSKQVKGLIHTAGIQSPGLSSTPAIADKVVELIEDYCKTQSNELELNYKENFQEKNPSYPHYDDYQDKPEEWQEFIADDKRYGKVVCRCETVTKKEIIDAINRPIPARTIDAIKRRTRATSGRCQGGFCGPRVVQILSEELDISPLAVSKRGGDSEILTAKAKELIKEKVDKNQNNFDKNSSDYQENITEVGETNEK